jgi:hypothetical protein
MRIKINTKHTICTAVHNHRIRLSYHTDQNYNTGIRLLNNMCNVHKLSVKIFLYRTESVAFEISFQWWFKYFHTMVLGFNVKKNSAVLHSSVLYHTFLVNSENNFSYMKVNIYSFSFFHALLNLKFFCYT